MKASAAQVSVDSKVKIQYVDQLLDHVTLKSTVLASLLAAQKTYTARMDLHVTMTQPLATQKSARLMMHNVKETLHPVSVHPFLLVL